jgi:protoporphyrinogen oxidase
MTTGIIGRMSMRIYKGYTPIKEVCAESEDELKEKVDNYLEKLMEFINKPVKDCPNCKGNGVILEKGPQIKL